MGTKDGARQLFLRESFGVLATISLDLPGYPFGSVTPYCADEHGQPIIYISTIAQHTRNILADPRVSLTIVESGGPAADVQARGRVTCVALARRVEAGETTPALHATPSKGGESRYFRYFPAAREYDGTHDFAFFRLELVRIRFIGGFGQIYWLEPAEFALANPFSAEEESRLLQPPIVGIAAEGFDVLSGGEKRRILFDAPVRTMDEARQALAAMAKRPA